MNKVHIPDNVISLKSSSNGGIFQRIKRMFGGYVVRRRKTRGQKKGGKDDRENEREREKKRVGLSALFESGTSNGGW